MKIIVVYHKRWKIEVGIENMSKYDTIYTNIRVPAGVWEQNTNGQLELEVALAGHYYY